MPGEVGRLSACAERSLHVVYWISEGDLILTTDEGVNDDGFSAVWTVKRKTFDTMLPGEGRLCHPQTTTRGLGTTSPNYPGTTSWAQRLLIII